MNLVEELGGYKDAQIHLEKLKEATEKQFGGMLTITLDKIDELTEALLQYRRKNEIYEVNDKVVLLESGNSVMTVIDRFEDRLVIDTGIKTTPDSDNTMAMALPIDMFRHATDTERQTGKVDTEAKAL